MPAQTRGFLFSDLRGYSAFTERHGDRAARELLARYRRIVREAIGRFGGAEIRTEGDSFYVVFASVSQAVEAGLAIQTGLGADDGEPIRASVGIHAGEVEDDAEQGIVSSAVNIAARICAVAEPGEVLASDTVRSLTRTYLDATFVPRGRRRLKGITDQVVLYRVMAVGSTPAGSRRRLGASAVAAIGVMALAAVVVLGALALANRAPTSDNPTRSPSAGESGTTPSSSTGPTSSVQPSAAGQANAFPNAAEQELLGRLPASLVPTCVRADADELPDAPPRAGQRTPFLAVAAVRCRVADRVNAFFFAAAGPTAPAETLHYHAGRRGVQDQTCEGDTAGLERWSFGPGSGWVLCSHDAYWTYDESSILGRAIGPDLETTMEWWREHARFPAD